ncbi:hypothetical protein [Clostridium sp.]|uniref:hypothetical protein n=1 Tax=Clostridium sp. TaxID=1506 RepID=UPI001A362BE8|nr:hypothetical protein [Clostridium sp.]MBK5234072.1 hypothetical protein [Clostridium sp.]
MIIIVEGIDRVGKTTLCNKLQKELQLQIFKHKNKDFDYKKMDNENETDKMLQLLQLNSYCKETAIIFDRFCWSDIVYGTLERNYDMAEAMRNLDKIEIELVKQNALIILMESEDLIRSSLEHGANLKQYDILFEKIYKISRVKRVKCSYTKINEIANAIARGEL